MPIIQLYSNWESERERERLEEIILPNYSSNPTQPSQHARAAGDVVFESNYNFPWCQNYNFPWCQRNPTESALKLTLRAQNIIYAILVLLHLSIRCTRHCHQTSKVVVPRPPGHNCIRKENSKFHRIKITTEFLYCFILFSVKFPQKSLTRHNLLIGIK